MCSAVFGCQVESVTREVDTEHCKARSPQPAACSPLTDLLAASRSSVGGKLPLILNSSACAWLPACLAPCSPAMSCQVSAGRVSSTSARMTSLSLASSLQAVHSWDGHKCDCERRQEECLRLAFPWQTGQSQGSLGTKKWWPQSCSNMRALLAAWGQRKASLQATQILCAHRQRGRSSQHGVLPAGRPDTGAAVLSAA